MLVLSRELGEKILIGKEITVTVVGIEGNRIKLAIGAPAQTTVLREELHVAGKPDQAEQPRGS